MAANTEKPRRAVAVEAIGRTLLDWTPSLIRRAEAQADRGDIRLAADLCELILTDDRVMGCTESLSAVVALPITFDPEESPATEALQGDFGDWWKQCPEELLAKLIKWGRVLGVAAAQIVDWKRDPDTGRMLATIEFWHPRNLRWDEHQDAWFARVKGGGEVRITPGDGQWILYTPYGTKRPWADAPWRGIARWWLIKRYAQHDWAGYSERQGNGTEVIEEKEPGEVPVADDGEERRKELIQDLQKLRRNAKIVLPPGYTYKLVESTARTWETFRAQKECADAAMAIGLVGQNLTTEVKGASLAAAEIHNKVQWRFIKSVAETISTTLRQQLLVWYVRFNFSAQIAPWPRYDTTPPEDLKAKAEAGELFFKTVKAADEAGYEILNVEELASRYGFVVVKKADAGSGASNEGSNADGS